MQPPTMPLLSQGARIAQLGRAWSASSASQRRLVHSPISQNLARRALLQKVYAPFQKLVEDSPELTALAHSGRVWEDYFQPGDSVGKGYTKLQEIMAPSLLEIDKLKDCMKVPANIIAKKLVAAYAHQSVQIEDNHLSQGDSMKVDDFLQANFFDRINIGTLSAQQLVDYPLPDVSEVVPQGDVNQLIELRNHLVASHWIATAALRKQGTMGLDEDDVRYLSALTMKDLGPAGYYPGNFGPKVRLGQYRQIPLGVRSNPLCIFPYPLEVPACMERFFQWRKMVHDEKKLHPLLIACQTVVYFVHIHPFIDGNGRVSRMIMHDYLLRHGYCPIVLQPFERREYLKMMSDAQGGNPEDFVARVVTTQLEMMYTLKMAEGTGHWD
ncbi:fic/DOC family protein [Thelonectria olida]|uniref:Fic/DOC family protein n=1 Tax=Thelonectria olida TaxID=1576542 RepID=A0A9P8WE73_9HYPO|nr:fic/DOC family protein [Thelonectria olida]